MSSEFSELLTGRRFFARLEALSLACPRCDQVYRIGRGSRTARAYDRHTARFSCSSGCGIRLTLGVLAHPVRHGIALPPVDAIALDWRQALALRELSRGVLLEERIPPRAPANRLLAVYCTCVRVVEDPGCPVHRATS